MFKLFCRENIKTEQIEVPKSNSETSVDLWKFFEERGSKLKESMFQVVTWIIGFASVVLGFAIEKGFDKELKSVAYPLLLVGIGFVGFLLLLHAVIIIRDYGNHINRTFARADIARKGESLPAVIWEAGENAKNESLPPVCWYLLFVVGLFTAAFGLIIVLGLCSAVISK